LPAARTALSTRRRTGRAAVGEQQWRSSLLKTGDAFPNPRGTVHQFINSSGQPLRVLTTVVDDKDEPRPQVVSDMPK
jgi:uncharacterized cupin superfamily protein